METKMSHDSETPAHGQQVISACAFIHHNFDGTEKLFLPKRAATKKFLPGVFELPGGHINFGEDIVEGLKREIREEFDMKVTIGDPFAAFTYENKIKGSHTIEVIYFGQFIEPIDHITINPEDHSTYEWFTLQDVKDRIGEIVAQEYAHHAMGNDPEYLTILKGFELLGGGKVRLQ
jgi:8-oxo-dGTP diphosphatase